MNLQTHFTLTFFQVKIMEMVELKMRLHMPILSYLNISAKSTTMQPIDLVQNLDRALLKMTSVTSLIIIISNRISNILVIPDRIILQRTIQEFRHFLKISTMPIIRDWAISKSNSRPAAEIIWSINRSLPMSSAAKFIPRLSTMLNKIS